MTSLIATIRRFVLIAAAAAVVLWTTPARGGWIEDRADGTTVIHVVLSQHAMPDPTRTDTASVAGVRAMKLFKQRFGDIFAARYKAKYQANPQIYGRHNWDKVEIELHRFTGIQVEAVESDLLAMAGGQAPDVMELNFRKSGDYIGEGFLYPLDKPEDGYLTSMSAKEKEFRIHEKLWPVIKRRGPKGKEHVWLMPFGGALGKVLLYRKDLFDAKGVAYPNENWTWADLYDAARKLTDPENGVYGILFGEHENEAWYWMTFLWSAGGEALEYDDTTGKWKCVFDSREAAVSLEFYVRLCTQKWRDAKGKKHRGYAYKDHSKGVTKWEDGKIAMQFEYIQGQLLSQINPEVTGMALVPFGLKNIRNGDYRTGEQVLPRAGELNSSLMGMFSQIKDPVIRDAAWEYIRFYDCIESMRIKTEVMVNGGLGRFIHPRHLDRFGYEDVKRLAPKGWARIYELALEAGRPEPYGRNSNKAYRLMSGPVKIAQQLALTDQLPEDYEQRLDALQDLLREGRARADEEMLGIITPDQRRMRDITASVVLAAIVVTFILIFRSVFKIFAPPDEGGAARGKWQFRRYKWAYVLMIPAVLTIFVWRYIPFARGSVMALMDYKIVGESTWVWVQNFGDVLWDGYWWQAVWNSLRYSFLIISLTFLPPILLAILLQEAPRGRLLFRLIYYLPAVTTGLVTIILWKQFYDPTEYGVLNSIVMNIPAIVFLAAGAGFMLVALTFAKRMLRHGMPLGAWLFALGGLVLLITCALLAKPIFVRAGESFGACVVRFFPRLFQGTPEAYRWLGNPNTAMLACVLPMVWAGMGPGCLIYLAALKGIPDDLYEAADIDGASFTDKILFVVFPVLKPLIIINFIGVFIGSWVGSTGRILAMTSGQANTEVAGLHIWYKAFRFLKFGPATAMAWVLASMLIGFTVHQLRILSRLEFRTTGEKE